MRRPQRRAAARLAAAIAAALLALDGASGCGTDDEPSAVTTTPSATGPTGPEKQPEGESKPSDEPGATTTTTPAAPGQPPESAAPAAGGGSAPPPTDSEENDIPPPPGSPAEQFEQQCEQNPEICE